MSGLTGPRSSWTSDLFLQAEVSLGQYLLYVLIQDYSLQEVGIMGVPILGHKVHHYIKITVEGSLIARP